MDVEKTFTALTRDMGVPLIKATDVERFVLSPITYWCDIHAPPELQDPLPPYLQHLFEIGHNYQADVIDNSYTGAVQKIFYDEEEGIRLTLELMSQGEHAIKDMPLTCRRMGLEGRPDLLVRVDDVESELGSFSYHVVEIKTARNIRKGHVLQGAVYNRLLGAAQGYEPPEFYIINRDRDVQTIRMADVEDELDDAVSRMRDVMNGEEIDPCHGEGHWPWESYINNLAIGVNDLSLIPGVGSAIREDLISAGFKKVGEVAQAQDQSLTKVHRVGATTARKFITSARAIQEGRPVRRGNTLPVPHANFEVFLDFEGTDPRIGTDGLEVLNYLIGASVRRHSEAAVFVPFFAESFDDEERNLREFLRWAESFDDAVFVHWHHYERTHLSKMIDHFGVRAEQASHVIDHLVDLYPIATKSFAFPAYGEGLKDIAKCLGFSWRHGDIDALTSVALYFKYLESDGSDDEVRQKILDYNEDDCRATLYVYEWLISQQV